MAFTTFKTKVRSTGGFEVITRSAGVDTPVMAVGTGSAPATTDAGAGITAGTGTIHAVSVNKMGSVIETKIIMDITGLTCGGANDDIIGVASATSCHIGQITSAVNGTIFAGYLRCLELPTGGDPDIDLYSAVESTGAQDAAVGATLTETKLCNSGDLTLGGTVVLTAFPADNEYLYLVDGTFTAAAYTAGKIEIVLYGTV